MAIFILLLFMTIVLIGTGVTVVLVIINYKSKEPAVLKPVARTPVTPALARGMGMPVPVSGEKDRVKSHAAKPDPKLFQGTAALIIGVVFVVLAGLIFATTAWHTLPSSSKVIMILVFSGILFGLSQVTGTIFKIERTSQAFYILGSIFLFLTVLAAGYFRLFGDSFTMAAQHRYKVLCAGSLATELAMIAGARQYKDRLYTTACFWGMSISAFFFLNALNLGIVDSLKGMVCYSFVLVLAGELLERHKAEASSGLTADFTSFARIHFWLFSVFMVISAGLGWIGLIGGHLLHGETTASYLTTVSLGMTAAGIVVIALGKKEQYLKVLHSISMIVFLHYLGLCIDTGYIYQLLIGVVLTGGWFFLEKRKGGLLSSTAGNCLYTVSLAFDTLVIMLIAFYNWDSMGEYLAASAAVILLAAVSVWWGKRYPAIRSILPLILYPLTVAARGMLAEADITLIGYELIVFGFLLAVVVWDIIKRDRFAVSVMVIGTVAQLLYWAAGDNIPLFALLLSGYLLAKSRRADGERKKWLEKGSCLYLLAGVFFIMCNLTETSLLQLIGVTAVFAGEYVVFCRYRREESRSWFWQVTGIVLLLLDMAAFYQDSGLASGYMVLCLMIFGVFYIMFYRSGSWWPHLLAAVSVLPMPVAAASRYALSEHQLYGFTAGALVISGVLARRLVPVITCPEEDGRGWRFDWFHILSVLVLVPMAAVADDGWRSVYLVVIALYVLQYTTVEMFKKSALTTASALAVLAFWLQPFIQYPELVSLEVSLIPAVLFVWYLGRVWKDRKDVRSVQTVLYCLCLAALVIAALGSGQVADALILEVVCLAVFVWANIRKNVLWLRISGAVIVFIVLYMTKDFWLSLSWWVYLLAAGLGLIVFAAVNELKKQ